MVFPVQCLADVYLLVLGPRVEVGSRLMIARIPLVLEPQPERGYTVTSSLLPELITEGDTMAEALANVEDAFAVVVEIYTRTRIYHCRRARNQPPGIC